MFHNNKMSLTSKNNVESLLKSNDHFPLLCKQSSSKEGKRPRKKKQPTSIPPNDQENLGDNNLVKEDRRALRRTRSQHVFVIPSNSPQSSAIGSQNRELLLPTVEPIPSEPEAVVEQQAIPEPPVVPDDWVNTDLVEGYGDEFTRIKIGLDKHAFSVLND